MMILLYILSHIFYGGGPEKNIVESNSNFCLQKLVCLEMKLLDSLLVFLSFKYVQILVFLSIKYVQIISFYMFKSIPFKLWSPRQAQVPWTQDFFLKNSFMLESKPESILGFKTVKIPSESQQ